MRSTTFRSRECGRADETECQQRFSRNPAETLRDEGLLRTGSQMRRDYENRGVRKPIANEPDKLGRWMEVLWGRRDHYRTQVDYLLMTLLFGARKSETAVLKWADRQSAAEIPDRPGARVLPFYDAPALSFRPRHCSRVSQAISETLVFSWLKTVGRRPGKPRRLFFPERLT